MIGHHGSTSPEERMPVSQLWRRPWWIAFGCALIAGFVHLGAVTNDFAMDDVPIVRDNPAAHSLEKAVNAWLEPYWPDSAGASAGQYRPFTILTFAADGTLSGRSVAWWHATNLVLHAVATALVVLVLSVWLSGWSLWIAGGIFAVHPVHVEAVAGLVGRAELLAAGAVLGAILAGRRYRSVRDRGRRWAWLGVIVFLVLVGLFSKEHAVVVIALLALDHVLTDRGSLRRHAGLYLAVAAATFAWLHIFRGVAGEFVEGSRAAVFRGLSEGQRIATMLPVQLDVMRLLTWPFDLASDYNPQAIVQRMALEWTGVLGLVVAAAVLALGAAAFRRAPAITFGILAGVMTYAPTSNILFASGVALAERNLYLAVLAPAAALGWVVTRFDGVAIRRWVLVGLGALAVAFAVRSVERVEAWEDTRTIVIEDIVDHPENYRTRLRLASYFVSTGNTAAALAEQMVAVALFAYDPFIATRSVPRALELGFTGLAVSEARHAYGLLPNHPVIAELLGNAYLVAGMTDSAAAVAQRAIVRAPRSDIPIHLYERVLVTVDASEWRMILNEARLHYIYGRLGQATTTLERAVRALEDRPAVTDCFDLGQVGELARSLAPRFLDSVEENARRGCPGALVPAASDR